MNHVDYKTAYIGLIGAITGSWLAVTGAIYAQNKLIEEKEAKQINQNQLKQTKASKTAIYLCKFALKNEIMRNHLSIKKFLEPLINGYDHFYLSNKNYYCTTEWERIQIKIIDLDIDIAARIADIYKYYQFLLTFDGTEKEAKEISQLDFKKYEDSYREVISTLDLQI